MHVHDLFGHGDGRGMGRMLLDPDAVGADVEELHARIPGGDHVVNELPVVLALLRLDVRPVETDAGDRAGETRPADWIALLAHPPLAGIGEQRIHLAKANPLQVVPGGARQESKKVRLTRHIGRRILMSPMLHYTDLCCASRNSL